jgi:hypothetical protein
MNLTPRSRVSWRNPASRPLQVLGLIVPICLPSQIGADRLNIALSHLTSWTTPLSDRSHTLWYQLKRWRSHNANRGRASR